MIDFSPTFTTFLICNDIPDCDDIDNAFSKRLRCINFPAEFVDKPDINKKNQKLINTDVNQNFANWKMDFMLLLLKYYKSFTENKKLELTVNILKWTNLYKENTDLYLNFLNERTKIGETNVFIYDLYEIFKEWFKENYPQAKIPNKNIFTTGIKKHYLIETINTQDEDINGKIIYTRKIGIRNLEIY